VRAAADVEEEDWGAARAWGVLLWVGIGVVAGE
jgi:hypothetical protein